MRVLVLGGTGFIGSHIVDGLLSQGHDVRVFASAFEKYRPPLIKVDYRIADFSDIVSLTSALEQIDIVYHLISYSVPSTSNLDPARDIQDNLVNTVNLLQLMLKKGVNRIVYSSSGGTVYGIPTTTPITEGHQLNPICSYGIVKIAIENYIKMFNQLYGLRYVIIRPSNPYGERQGHLGVQGIIGTAFDKIQTRSPLVIWGDGSIIRDYIYVKDLAKLFVMAASSSVDCIVNAGSGVGISINNVLSCIETVTGGVIEKQFSSARSFDIPRIVLSNTKVMECFGWMPETDFITGLRYCWNWLTHVCQKEYRHI